MVPRLQQRWRSQTEKLSGRKYRRRRGLIWILSPYASNCSMSLGGEQCHVVVARKICARGNPHVTSGALRHEARD